jgi:copper homeostasis protein (lipoprotein)
MKQLLFFSLVAVSILTACKSENSGDTNQNSQAEHNATSEEISHTAIKSRDHIGLYQGVLPCSDCEGIETSLYLMANNAYLLTKVYTGLEDDRAFKNIGDFKWNEDGTTVTLSNIDDAPNQFIVEDTQAIQLDMNGNKVEGELAEKYVLTKQ